MLGDRQLTIDDYMAILRRHLWLIVIPPIVCALVAYGISLALPPRYESTTLVLVEQQKVPESFVKPVVTEEVNLRLSTMQERILSRTRLQPIIERFGLYKEDAGRVTMEEVVGRLRRAITVTPVRPLTGSSSPGIAGFSVSVSMESPRVAQQVCGEITSMFIEENLRLREQSAQGTTDFLAKQLEDAKHNLDDQDAKMAAFKSRYIGQLPDQEQRNLGLLMGLKTQLDAVTELLNRTQRDKSFAESLLSQHLAAWQASQTSNNPQTLEQQIASLQAQLANLEVTYTNDYPDVVKLKNSIAELKKKVQEADAAGKGDLARNNQQKVALTEPPQVQQLRVAIHQDEETIRAKAAEQQRLQDDIKIFEARVQLSPKIEEEYKDLTRNYQTALSFYNELLAKKNQSEMATDLERRQEGEQFRVLDPANLPEKPSFPDRRLFTAGGFGGGLVLGLGIAMLLEIRDKSLRTERDVEFYLQLPTLAVVPVVGEEKTRKKRFWKRSRGEPPRTALRLEA